MNILPQKRWHLYRHDNRLRVQRDEERYREEESRQRQQHEQKCMSDILTLLKRRKVEATMNASKQAASDPSLADEASHQTTGPASASQSGVHTPQIQSTAAPTLCNSSSSSFSAAGVLVSSSSSSQHPCISSSSSDLSSSSSKLPSVPAAFSPSSTRRLSPGLRFSHTHTSSSSPLPSFGSLSSSSSTIATPVPGASPSSSSSARGRHSNTSFPGYSETLPAEGSLAGLECFLESSQQGDECAYPSLIDEGLERLDRGGRLSSVGKIIRIRSLPSSTGTSREETSSRGPSTIEVPGSVGCSQSVPKTSWFARGSIPSSALSFSKVADTVGNLHSMPHAAPSKSRTSSSSTSAGGVNHSARESLALQPTKKSGKPEESRHINFFAEEEKELEKIEAKRQKYLKEAGYTPNAQSDFDNLIRVSLHQRPWYHCPPSTTRSKLPSKEDQEKTQSTDRLAEETERERILHSRRIQASAVVADILEEKRKQLTSGEKKEKNVGNLPSQKGDLDRGVLTSRVNREGYGGVPPGVWTPGMTIKGMVFEEDEDRLLRLFPPSVDSKQEPQDEDVENIKRKEKGDENTLRRKTSKEKKVKKKKDRKKKDKKRRKEKSWKLSAREEERTRRRRPRPLEDGESICLLSGTEEESSDKDSPLVLLSDSDSTDTSVCYCEEEKEKGSRPSEEGGEDKKRGQEEEEEERSSLRVEREDLHGKDESKTRGEGRAFCYCVSSSEDEEKKRLEPRESRGYRK